MYNFDKDYEDDRELLREDPYAEYPDFPKECRMTDMAQMDMYNPQNHPSTFSKRSVSILRFFSKTKRLF